jgi:hypothetical protein
MALSPNYGWSEPDNSSLVKNGAQDIRALGDAIDTSVWNVGYGQAGKNKVINGDFGIWQRGTSFANVHAFTADRFKTDGATAVAVQTLSQLAVGPNEIAGFDGAYAARLNVTNVNGATKIQFLTRIEDVRTLANDNVTLSFWAKADSARTLSLKLSQQFGSGGSAGVDTAAQNASVTTSWTRFTLNFTLASIVGKTIGTGSFVLVEFNYPLSTFTIDITGVQLEYGSKATPFQTASGGSPQAELAMCQRYYFRTTTGVDYGTVAFGGIGASTTAGAAFLKFPVTMRTNPTAIEFSTLAVNDTASIIAVTSVTLNKATPDTLDLTWNTAAGVTQFRPYKVISNNSAAGYLAVTAEL